MSAQQSGEQEGIGQRHFGSSRVDLGSLRDRALVRIDFGGDVVTLDPEVHIEVERGAFWLSAPWTEMKLNVGRDAEVRSAEYPAFDLHALVADAHKTGNRRFHTSAYRVSSPASTDEWCREENCRHRHWRSGSMPTHRRGSECPDPSSSPGASS